MQSSLNQYLTTNEPRKFFKYENPKGLFVIENAVNEELNNEIIDWFNSDEIQSKLKGVWGGKGRKVIQYGSPYLYDKKIASSDSNAVDPIPPILEKLTNLIYELSKHDNFVDGKDVIPPNFKFTQSIINQYLPGEGINPHTDLTSFGPIVASFTFLSGREMEFTREIGDKVHSKKIYTFPKTLYIMTEDSRYLWKHQMRQRKTDHGVQRQKCFSITFRCSPQNK